MKEAFKLLKKFSDVERYLDTVQRLADENREAFGFLAKSAYLELASKNGLWVVADEQSEYAGHLIFGGRFPSLKVFQVLVAKQHRSSGVGAYLVRSLIDYAQSHSFLSISARVAADLFANKFWERMGFVLIRQEPGGKSTNRVINIRVKELKTPSLLTQMGDTSRPTSLSASDAAFTNRPLLSTPSYAFDLNVLFDLIRQRERMSDVEQIVGIALAGKIKLCVTSEFAKELTKRSFNTAADPLLSFARGLPTLPGLSPSQVEPLLKELSHIVFPSKAFEKLSDNDLSDLTHLAECIHHKVFGFITSEKSFLRARDVIQENYDLDIVSPSDLRPAEETEIGNIFTDAACEKHEVSFRQLNESERRDAEEFLIQRHVSVGLIASILDPGVSNAARRRIAVKADNSIVALASWSVLDKHNHHTTLYLVVNESHPVAIKVIDHLLENVFRDAENVSTNRIDLIVGLAQDYTKQTAIQRGFRKHSGTDVSVSSSDSFSKISVNGILTAEDWGNFVSEFRNLSGLKLPSAMPTANEWENTGLVAKTEDNQHGSQFSLFEFESLISPGLVLYEGRGVLMVPVQRQYAKDLFTPYQARYEAQRNLFPGKESLLYAEKSYFRSARHARWFTKGTPVIFYVSGKDGGQKAAVGIGRVTYSDQLTPQEIQMNLARQGVLDYTQLEKLVEHSSVGKAHAFTFDNFSLFPNAVSFEELRAMGLVSRANLVTVEKVKGKGLQQLIATAYGSFQGN